MGTDGESELLLVAANILDRIDGFSCSICPRIVLGAQCNKLMFGVPYGLPILFEGPFENRSPDVWGCLWLLPTSKFKSIVVWGTSSRVYGYLTGQCNFLASCLLSPNFISNNHSICSVSL